MSPNRLVAGAPRGTPLRELTAFSQTTQLVGRGYKSPPKIPPLRGSDCVPVNIFSVSAIVDAVVVCRCRTRST